MRKKTIKNLCDNVFWYIIYLLPLILLCISMFSVYQTYDWTTMNVTDIWEDNLIRIMQDCFGMGDTSVIFDTFSSIFGQASFIPTFIYNDGVCMYITYFVTMVLVHLVVDFLLFIPRIAHKFLNAFTKED